MRSGLSREGVAARKGVMRDFFALYYATYHKLVREHCDDFALLLDFFAVPMTITTSETHVCLTDDDAVLAAFRANVMKLRSQRYEKSVPVRNDFRILNDKACLAEVDWVRTGRNQEEISRLSMAYLLADTDAGLRITAMVVLGQPPEDVRVVPGTP